MSSFTGKSIRVTQVSNGNRVASEQTIIIGAGHGAGGPGAMRIGSGVISKSQRSLGPFERVVARSVVAVCLHMGEGGSAEIEADDNLHDLIDTRIEDGTLFVEAVGSFSCEQVPRLTVCSSTVVEARVEGAGDIQFSDVHQPKLRLSVWGSGDIRGSGCVDFLEAQVNGSGDIRFGKVRAKSAQLSVKGSGDIDATVIEAVVAHVDGSGDIRIRGKPTGRQTQVRGSGDIEFD